jgi:hypothetical protein
MMRLAWVKGSEADRQKMLAEFQPAAMQPSEPANHLRETATDAAAKCEASLKKDAHTMAEFELLMGAADCDTLVQELRRKGGQQNLANAATWEQAASSLRAAAARQRGEQQATQTKSAPPPSQQNDPRREAALAAVKRFGDFLAKDASTVSEQEMLARRWLRRLLRVR